MSDPSPEQYYYIEKFPQYLLIGRRYYWNTISGRKFFSFEKTIDSSSSNHQDPVIPPSSSPASVLSWESLFYQNKDIDWIEFIHDFFREEYFLDDSSSKHLFYDELFTVLLNLIHSAEISYPTTTTSANNTKQQQDSNKAVTRLKLGMDLKSISYNIQEMISKKLFRAIESNNTVKRLDFIYGQFLHWNHFTLNQNKTITDLILYNCRLGSNEDDDNDDENDSDNYHTNSDNNNKKQPQEKQEKQQTPYYYGICNVLQYNTTLECLDLSYNDIGDTVCIAIAKAVGNNTSSLLKKLLLTRNKISDHGCIALSNYVLSSPNNDYTCPLTCLGLRYNDITNKGCIALANTGLKTNTSLLTLNIANNQQITNDGWEALATILPKQNMTIQEIVDMPTTSSVSSSAIHNSEFYLRLNILGRRDILLQKQNKHRNTSNQPFLWMNAIIQASKLEQPRVDEDHQDENNLKYIYYFIRHQPEMCCC